LRKSYLGLPPLESGANSGFFDFTIILITTQMCTVRMMMGQIMGRGFTLVYADPEKISAFSAFICIQIFSPSA
jgi:hypothetical protein